MASTPPLGLADEKAAQAVNHDIAAVNSTIDNTAPKIPPINSSSTPPVRQLSPEDLRIVRTAIGAPPIRAEEPSNTHTPPPHGLYKAIRTKRRSTQYRYYFSATLYNTCLILQLLLGASLTALGSSANNRQNGTAITILAAANTVNAGLCALLHNSGLPGRIRNDWNEYAKVEMFLIELMDSGIVDAKMTREDCIQNCFNMYATARATVEKNKPSYYSGANPAKPGVLFPPPT